MTIHTSQLLEKLLSGHQLTVDELDDLVKQKTREDQFLEFKHGLEIEEGKDASKTIRDYMCGFANSEGGVLIIGVDAPSSIPLSVTGCNNHKKGDLAEWAARCLSPIAAYFSPIPKFQVLHHSNGEVLICVAQRSLNLVSQIENGKTVYYLRFHDQTLQAPEYLIIDLLLGRRQKPDFDIVDWKVLNFRHILDNDKNTMDLEFDFRLKCENRSIVWAEESMWGTIAWIQSKESMYAANVNRPGSHLLSFVDVQDLPIENHIRQGILLHFSKSLNISKPFDTGDIVLSLNAPIRYGNQWFSYDWMAALYLVAKNSQPIWYQINLRINMDSIKWVDDKTIISPNENSNSSSVTKLISERPIVAWKTNE